MVAAVLVLAGVALLGLGADGAWFPGAALGAVLGLLFVLNVVDPEAIVVRHNGDRATEGRPIDPDCLAELSDDAVPALVSALPWLPEPERADALAAVCGRSEPSFGSWAAANTSCRRAVDARRQVCRSQGVMR